MGTVKTILRVESKDVFPAPIDFVKVSYNKVLGDYSTFSQVETNSFTPVILNIASLATGVAYVYVETPSTNETPVYIRETSSGTVFCVLYPGAIGIFPYAQTANGANDIEAISAGPGTNMLNYFIGTDVNTTTYDISINSFMQSGYVAGYVG
jgi:hypothetical protein